MSGFASRLRSWWVSAPPDAIAFVAIVLGMVITHLPFIRHGMCFNDPAWYFHFGRRAIAGEVPYRDYIFQVGPLPIYVDAAFQDIFGEKYVSSLFAALFIKTLRVFVIWLIARRIAGWRAAIGLVVFCAFDPMFSFAHHWSTSYAELCFTLSGLFLVLASRTDGRTALVHLALAGFAAGFVVTSRQSTAVMIGVVLFPATAIMLARRDYFTVKRFVALWGGFAIGFALVFVVLAMAGALGPAIQQMFLDAGEKKGLDAVNAFFDAISGGAMANGSFSRFGGFMKWIALPSLVVAGALYLAARDRPVSTSTVAMLAMPVALLFALVTRYGSFEIIPDLPRTFLTVTTAFAVLAPNRLRVWFGMEPLVALGLGALPLASDWALEMSFPGRGWGDPWGLVTGGVLICIASSRLRERTKTMLCGAFAVMGIVHVVLFLHADLNPFAKDNAIDGTLTENAFLPHPRGTRHPMLRGLRMPQWRALALEWLASEVTPGSTCFVYANAPALYDLLDCRNPTQLDDTITDFFTARDAEKAVAALRANPPDFIIAHDRTWLSPPISLDLGGRLDQYESWNARASMTIHVGLRSIIDQYESRGTVGDAIGPGFAKIAAGYWDAIDALHVYRRK